MKSRCNPDWGILLLRIVVGIIFIYHGSQKWALWGAPPAQMSPNMLMLFRFLSIVEPLGGVGLIVGVLTQWAALGLAIIMVGAIYMKIAVMNVTFGGKGGAGWEFDLVLLASAILLSMLGSGAFALSKKLRFLRTLD